MQYLKMIWEILTFIGSLFIPHFIREQVAVLKEGDEYRVLCRMEDLDPGERYDLEATSEALAFLGVCFFPKLTFKEQE